MPMKDRPSSALKPPPEGTLCYCSPGDPSLGYAPTEGMTTGVIDVSGIQQNIQRTSLQVQHTNNVRLSELTNQLKHTNNVRLSELTNQLRHQFAGSVHKQRNLQQFDQSDEFLVRTGFYSENGSELLITKLKAAISKYLNFSFFLQFQIKICMVFQ